jgi:hypothetical protein
MLLRHSAISLMISLLSVLAIACSGCKDSGPETTRTEKSFASDAQRTAFIQNFLPLTIPQTATGFQFTYVDWLDWDISGSFTLPSKDFGQFSAGLSKLGMTADNSLAFTTANDQSTGTISIEPTTRTVRFKCSNPPPQSTPASSPASQGASVGGKRPQ